MPSAQSNHVVVHLYAERINVDLILIYGDLGIDRVDAVLSLLVEHQQFADGTEGLSVQN